MGMGSPDTRPPWADDSCWVGLPKPRRGGSMSITRQWRVFCCPETFGLGNEVTAVNQTKLFPAGNSRRRLGAWLRFHADGCLIRDDPCIVANLFGDGAGHLDGHGKRYEGSLHLVLEELHPEIVGSVLILGLVTVLVESNLRIKK